MDTHLRALQSRFESPKPGVEVPPVIEPFLENRLPDLLRACGVHAALGFVKLHAVRFEAEPAELQNPRDACVEVADHGLMIDPQNLAGKSGAPMRHQLDVHSVIASDVLDTVGELLAGCEELL